jgi:hypothetical protein
MLPLQVCHAGFSQNTCHASLISSWTAGSIFTDATSLGGEVGTVVTCAYSLHRPGASPSLNSVIAIGGMAFTEVTSAGGAVITLAESGAGVVTTFAGSVYTVATAAAASAATGTKYAYNPD